MTDPWKEQLDAAVAEFLPEAIQLRRHLHAHPEPSGEELYTSLELYQLLGKLDLDVRMGPDGCGVVADGGRGDLEKRVALRGDIDALRIQDEKQVDYHSTREGVMHACGHDAHTAIAYGAIRCLVLLEQQQRLPWPVLWRGIFQPAEETATGASRMVEAGALERVSQIFALHVDPTRRTGVVGLRSGAMTASCDSLEITVRGQGGHAARPHESKDPIAAAAQLISTLYQFVPRATASHDAVVLTIGSITGGMNPNVIPDRVHLQGTMRTLESTVRTRAIEQIRQVARGVGEITDTEVEVALHGNIPSVYNDPELSRLVWQQAEEVLGADNVQLVGKPSMGSEDFACYLAHVPGAMFRLGSTRDLATVTPLHTPKFDIDEQAIGIGMKILARAAVMSCRPDGE